MQAGTAGTGQKRLQVVAVIVCPLSVVTKTYFPYVRTANFGGKNKGAITTKGRQIAFGLSLEINGRSPLSVISEQDLPI